MPHKTGFEYIEEDNENVLFLRGYKDIRRAAMDWQTFSNDALGRIQIPAEDKTRSFRQCPIEFDSPQHGQYRSLVEEVFAQPLKPDYVAVIEAVVDSMVLALSQKGRADIVSEFALPLQSKALTLLLGMPLSEADLWVSWGMHVFRQAEGYDLERAGALVAYLEDRLARAETDYPGSFFAKLSFMQIEGRKLTHDEKMGFAHLVFAGGRDTVIQLISGGLIYFAQNPEAFQRLKKEPLLAVTATEELVRFISPLNFLGRVCQKAIDINGFSLSPGQRIALSFADANRDETVFADPDHLLIDRRPNPHVGFGSGPHSCLGSAHARLLSRTVLVRVARHIEKMNLASEIDGFNPPFEEVMICFH